MKRVCNIRPTHARSGGDFLASLRLAHPSIHVEETARHGASPAPRHDVVLAIAQASGLPGDAPLIFESPVRLDARVRPDGPVGQEPWKRGSLRHRSQLLPCVSMSGLQVIPGSSRPCFELLLPAFQLALAEIYAEIASHRRPSRKPASYNARRIWNGALFTIPKTKAETRFSRPAAPRITRRTAGAS